jgi:uncharacterized phage-associated protein
MDFPTVPSLTASDIAKYYLIRSTDDGELISPLKMQKLIYYAYVWTLVKNRKRIFNERIEAWANGPVVRSLYQELRTYGSSPIPLEFLGSESPNELKEKFPADVLSTLDEVYEQYMQRTAFELSVLTHNEQPWIQARGGLEPTQNSNNRISDDSIIEYYHAST